MLTQSFGVESAVVFTQFLGCWVDSCVDTITVGLGRQLCSHNLRGGWVGSCVHTISGRLGRQLFSHNFREVGSAVVFTQFSEGWVGSCVHTILWDLAEASLELAENLAVTHFPSGEAPGKSYGK